MDKEMIKEGWKIAAEESGISYDSLMNKMAYSVKEDTPDVIKGLIDEWWDEHPSVENRGM